MNEKEFDAAFQAIPFNMTLVVKTCKECPLRHGGPDGMSPYDMETVTERARRELILSFVNGPVGGEWQDRAQILAALERLRIVVPYATTRTTNREVVFQITRQLSLLAKHSASLEEFFNTVSGLKDFDLPRIGVNLSDLLLLARRSRKPE